MADDAARDGMGTTRHRAAALRRPVAALNVGDSRCYLLRDGELTQLTKDDTFVQSLVDQGVLTARRGAAAPAAVDRHPGGAGRPRRPAGRMIPVQPGDRFLLCSDGLSDYVEDEVIAADAAR